jgi:hypothetical protein
MAEPYVLICAGAARAPAVGPSTEIVLRERLCSGPTTGQEREQTLINFEFARNARLDADEHARDAQHGTGTGRWRSSAAHREHDTLQGFARGIEVHVDDAEIAARQSARELAVRGVALDEAYMTQALAAGGMQNAAALSGASVLVQTAVANAVSSVRGALSSPSGSPATVALEEHVAEVATAAGRPIAGRARAARTALRRPCRRAGARADCAQPRFRSRDALRRARSSRAQLRPRRALRGAAL